MSEDDLKLYLSRHLRIRITDDYGYENITHKISLLLDDEIISYDSIDVPLID
jgi:hypothetical protein